VVVAVVGVVPFSFANDDDDGVGVDYCLLLCYWTVDVAAVVVADEMARSKHSLPI
jgi:hypothetical protein